MRKTKKLVSSLAAAAMICTMSGTGAMAADFGAEGYADFPEVYPAEKIEKLSSLEIEQKVDALIESMTMEEKYAMLGGTDMEDSYGTGFLRGVPRLGVPILRMWDGPKGVIGDGRYETTSPTSELGLASSFDRDLAYRYGEIHGKDNKAIGGNVQLGVQLDQVRSPFFLRSRDTFGEDAYLTGSIGTEVSQGVEDQNVLSVLKHMAGYSYQFTRTDDNFLIDEQTLHESFLLPYEMIIKAEASHGVMASYNLINGTQTNESPYLLENVLRTMWGMQGLTMTDWAACKVVTTHLGLDLEMGRISKNNQENIEAEIEAGNMTMEDIDEAVRHVLTAYGKIGYLGLVEVNQAGLCVEDPNPPEYIDIAIASEEERTALLEEEDAVALESAVKGAVLLKNENDTLPIQEGSVAMIGVTGSHTLTGHYRESSFGWLKSMTSPYENMKKIYEGGEVVAEEAYDIIYDTVPEEALFTDEQGTENGVVFVKENETSILPTVELTTGTIDGEINRTYKNAEDGNALVNGETATLTTYVKAPESGEYRFKLLGIGGKRSLTIEGYDTLEFETTGFGKTSIVRTDEGMDIPGEPSPGQFPPGMQIDTEEEPYEVVAQLEKDQLYKITVTIEATQDEKDGQLRLTWQKPGQKEADYENAIQMAKENDTVVVFVHDLGDDNRNYRQRVTLALADEEQQLIEDVATAAKEAGNKVVVVLNIALPVTMDWIDDVDAVLNMWLPGQAGGLATAQLLTGVENPSGKLSVTFPKADGDTQHGEMLAKTEDLTPEEEDEMKAVTEGIFSGYRWYDHAGIEPLFDFGYGLSYTEFEYSNLKVTPAEDDSIDVTFTVTNVGDVKGSEVAQVYLGAAEVPEGIQMADYALAQYYRFEDLEPGESQTATVNISKTSLSYWNATTKVGVDAQEDLVDTENTEEKWTLAKGSRMLYVGSSSDHFILETEIEVGAEN